MSLTLKEVTIEDFKYLVEPVSLDQMITGNHYVFYGIQWYRVIGFDISNHK